MKIDFYKKTANDYLKQKNAECSHIEYKASELQLDKILKTICAYGNNYYQNDYSFIYVGVEEENTTDEKSIPKLPIKGILESKLEIAKNTLNSLRPYIYPNVKFEILTNEIDGIKYLLIVVERQSGGPFQVTERAEKDKKISLRPGRYIRIDSDTRLARVDEEYELLRKFSCYHFSSDVSSDASIDDLDFDYMKEYMNLTSDRLLTGKMTKEDIAKALGLFGENELETSRVKNYSVLMFSDEPNRFIPYSYLEVITDTFGSAKRMEAKSFDGPIWRQYYASLKYIEDNFLRTITLREDNIATNRKITNFPFKAVEELLANAIVHKNYESGKSIQVYITNEEINIINYNKPLPPLTIDDLNKRNMFHERDSVNPEIRDMFKALGIIESYGTGIGEAKKACEENGSSPIYYKNFKNNDDITSVVIPCSEEYQRVVNGKTTNSDELIEDKMTSARKIIKDCNYSDSIKNNLDKILLEFYYSIFSSKDIVGSLKCSINTATSYASKLLKLNLVEAVSGIGKGKYKFK